MATAVRVGTVELPVSFRRVEVISAPVKSTLGV